MRAAVLVMLVSTVALGGALGAAHGAWHATPPVDDDTFVRGVALGLFATDSEWDYGPLVEEILARGAMDVLVVVNSYQSNRFASDIAPRPGHSPSEATVTRTLSQVKSAGMRAALMPVVRLQTRAPHDWRGVIAPADGLDAWFESYRRFVLPLARIAEDAGAQRFVVGSELGSLEPYEERWRALISEVRERFSRTLTYSANWDRSHAVEFWDALDEVGLTAYFPLASDGEPTSADALAHAWRTPRAEIDALARRVGKPVLITEIAARPTTRGTTRLSPPSTSVCSNACTAASATPSRRPRASRATTSGTGLASAARAMRASPRAASQPHTSWPSALRARGQFEHLQETHHEHRT